MSEPRRYVHRKKSDSRLFGSGAYLTAPPAAGAIAFGGTATGVTPTVDGGTASGAITFPAYTITEITALFYAQSPVSFGGSASGYGYIARTAAATVAFGGTATAANIASSAIRFGGNATAASGFFTSEVAATMSFAGSASGINLATATGGIAFSGTVAQPEVSGGTVEGVALPAEITFAGTASSGMDAFVTLATGSVTFGGAAAGTRIVPSITGDEDVDGIKFQVQQYGTIRITLV